MSTVSVPDFWWPIDFTDRGRKIFLSKKALYSNSEGTLDIELYKETNLLIERMMRANLQDILDRDSIPNLCHVLNGWGNSTFEGQKLVHQLRPFVFLKEGDKPFIEQCTPEGDFHPWQSFAYSSMAGIEGDTEIGDTGFTLKKLMQNSVRINHHEGEELGHLLFALATYFKGDLDLVFEFNNGEFNIAQLLDWGIENHITGSFRVCRKFHLTEGICAMAALNPNFKEYRLVAQKFLEGQTDLIIIIAAILEEASEAMKTNSALPKNSISHEYREQIMVLDYLENHVYYAGHIIELASLAIIMGYEISKSQRNAIIKTINLLNEIIPKFAPKMSFVDCFLGFGHYRRAITLFSLIESGEHNIDWSLLDKYKVNFDQIEPMIFSEESTNNALENIKANIFNVIDPQDRINPVLASIIDHYDDQDISETHGLRGKFPHFRRVCPKGWPKSVHYEILDYGEKHKEVGIELHLESEEVKYIKAHFKEIQTLLRDVFEDVKFKFDEQWYNGSGRLYAIYNYESHSPEQISNAFIKLIQSTESILQEILTSKYIKIV